MSKRYGKHLEDIIALGENGKRFFAMCVACVVEPQSILC